MDLQGCFVALVTPFKEEGGLDLSSLEHLIEWHIEEGTDGIILSGTTGESPTLSLEEKLLLFQKGVQVSRGRIPIIAGVGSYDTAASYRDVKAVQEMGVDAALVIVPYYNRPTMEGCFLHYQKLSEVGLPLIVYHHPGRTGVKLSSATLQRITELPQVIGIKDCAPEMSSIISSLQCVDKPLLCGDDPLVIPCIASGARGIISVIANVIPREWKELTTYLLAGRMEEARSLFTRYYPLCEVLGLETNPQPIKYALSLKGKCLPIYRLPLVAPAKEVQEKIRCEMESVLGIACK